MSSGDDFRRLELITAIGFNGQVNRGLIIHPDR